MKSTIRHAKILSLIDAAYPLLHIEIDKADQGNPAVDSLRSLLFIKGRLDAIAEMIRTGSILKDERYRGSMAHLVVDTWPLNHPLGAKISEIEYEFYR